MGDSSVIVFFGPSLSTSRKSVGCSRVSSLEVSPLLDQAMDHANRSESF